MENIVEHVCNKPFHSCRMADLLETYVWDAYDIEASEMPREALESLAQRVKADIQAIFDAIV